MNLGPYTSFIVMSYALVAFVVIALIVWIVVDFRRQQQVLRNLEASGVKRRSAKSAKSKGSSK